eukprot:2912409-Prorocentrum_lima.AAC.1
MSPGWVGNGGAGPQRGSGGAAVGSSPPCCGARLCGWALSSWRLLSQVPSHHRWCSRCGCPGCASA